MKETKVYVVKKPFGEYEDYQEPIVKVFLDETKAKSYVKEENAKLPLEQAKKCNKCCYKWECVGQKGKETPSCFKGDKYNYCENYFKFHDIQELFIEEHSIDDIKIHDQELVKEVLKRVKDVAFKSKVICDKEGLPCFGEMRQIYGIYDYELDQIQKEFEK